MLKSMECINRSGEPPPLKNGPGFRIVAVLSDNYPRQEAVRNIQARFSIVKHNAPGMNQDSVKVDSHFFYRKSEIFQHAL